MRNQFETPFSIVFSATHWDWLGEVLEDETKARQLLGKITDTDKYFDGLSRLNNIISIYDFKQTKNI